MAKLNPPPMSEAQYMVSIETEMVKYSPDAQARIAKFVHERWGIPVPRDLIAEKRWVADTTGCHGVPEKGYGEAEWSADTPPPFSPKQDHPDGYGYGIFGGVPPTSIFGTTILTPTGASIDHGLTAMEEAGLFLSQLTGCDLDGRLAAKERLKDKIHMRWLIHDGHLDPLALAEGYAFADLPNDQHPGSFSGCMLREILRGDLDHQECAARLVTMMGVENARAVAANVSPEALVNGARDLLGDYLTQYKGVLHRTQRVLAALQVKTQLPDEVSPR